MASREEILDLAGQMRRGIETGAIRPDEVTPKGQLLFDLGAGSRTFESLTRDDLTALGVETPPSLTDRATGAVSGAASGIGDFLSKASGLFTKGIPAAGRAFMERAAPEAPTFGDELRRRAQPEPVLGGPPRQPTFLDRIIAPPQVPGMPPIPGALDIAGALDLGERAMRIFSGVLAGGAELGPEKAKPLTEALLGVALGIPPRAALGALATDVRGLTQKPVIAPPPAPPIRRLPEMPLALPPGREPLALAAGQPEAGIVIPRSMVRPRTDIALPEGTPPPAPKALPPAPRGAEVRPAEAPPPSVSGRGIPPEVDIAPVGDVRARVEALRDRRPVSTAADVALRRTGGDPTLPTERPTAILDVQGRPIRVPVRPAAKVVSEQPPVAPSEPPPPKRMPTQAEVAQTRAGIVPPRPAAPVVPQAPVPPPPAPPLPRPVGTVPPPPVPRPKVRPKGEKVVDVGTVDLGDPDDVGQLVRGFRGINFGALKGEAKAVPLAFRNNKGVALDELVTNIADAQGLKPRDVERRLMDTLERFSSLKADKRAGRLRTLTDDVIDQGDVQPPPASSPATGIVWNPITPPTPGALGAFRSQNGRFVVEQLSPDVWRARDTVQGAETTTATFHDARQWAAAQQAPKTTPQVPPSAPRTERTAFGDQALIPGAESRTIPQAPLRAKRPQADVEDTPLFGDRQGVSDRAQTSLLEPPKAPTIDPANPFGNIDDLVEGFQGEPGEAGKVRAETATRTATTAAGGAIGGTQGDTPEERFRNAVLGAAAGFAAPTAFKGARALGERGSMGRPNEPPPVPPQFRRESVGPTGRFAQGAARADETIGKIEDIARQPVSVDDVRAGAQRVIQQAKNPESMPTFPEVSGGGNLPPRVTMNLPADIPGDPLPEATRAAKFFTFIKRPIDDVLPPEEVVKGDPAGRAIVHLTYRRGQDGHRLKRELEEKTREIFRGISAPEIEQISVALDTALPGRIEAFGGLEAARAVETPLLRQMLPPRLAEVAIRARSEVLDAFADGTGLPRGQRFTSYFPRFRDTVRMEETKLVLNPEGEAYLSKTFLGDIPENFAQAFFHKQRTATDPPSRLGLDAYLIYARSTARHLTMHGGFHPATKEVVPGYLTELQGLIQQPVQQGLKPFLAEFVNDFLGVTSKGSPQGRQVSRIIRNVEFSRTIGANLTSPIANLTQQVNTLAWVRPQAWVRGYVDLLNPQRRALARRFIGLDELAKADLERVQDVASRLDRIEDLTSRVAQVTGTLFRASETQGNRYHAFLAGLRDAEAFGLKGNVALEYARDIVDVSQFPTGGPAAPMLFRSPRGSVIGQFKQFQIRQALNIKNIVMADIADYTALLHGRTRVPIEVRGKVFRDPLTGQMATRPIVASSLFPRTARFLVGLSLVGGPDAVYPGFDEWLQEQGVKVPGLFPAIGAGIAQMAGFGFVTPGDITRSFLFFLPGPLVGHAQDMASAASGVEFGRGLTELVNGDLFRELTFEERVNRAMRAIPVAGIAAGRGRQALKQMQTPGEERAALTILEGLGLQPATGPQLRRDLGTGDVARTAIGIPSRRREMEFEESRRLIDLERRSNVLLRQAADLLAAGRGEDAERLLRDGERRLKLAPGTLDVSRGGAREAEQRREHTPLERRRFNLRNRFPDEVEQSRQRVPGVDPDEPPRFRRRSR